MQRVKIGVVGCGVVASAYYLPYLMGDKRVEISAICDLSERRTAECQRLFGAQERYHNYDDMLKNADIDAVFILTAPGTHVEFSLKALALGKHILLQKPMATTMADAHKIAEAVRQAGVKAVIEPSTSTPLNPDIAHLRELVKNGVLGKHLWFTAAATGPTKYDISLTVNPYGKAAFFDKDSGGHLFDLPYAPSQIVGILGACKSVSALTSIGVPTSQIVTESKYDEFLESAKDPDTANYWDAVLDLDRAETVTNEAVDNAYSLYEMADGTMGALHIGRIFHPVLPGSGSGSFQIFGTAGNLVFGAGYEASIISNNKDMLPHVDKDGWYHVPLKGDQTKAKWPQPTPGSFNYYHESSRHLIDCIINDFDTIPNIEWGLHITEMMFGALESARTGKRYEMKTTLDH